MKIRIGAIGPPDSLQKIRGVADSDPRIELVEFEYLGSEELPEIMSKHRYDVTQWIFSGQVPYYYCLERGLISEEEAMFSPQHGMALLGTCLQVMQEQGRFVSRISLDTVDGDIVNSLFLEYHLGKISFSLLDYKTYKDYDEIINFHLENIKSGRAEVVITCLLKVYLDLQKLGIPCYRIMPSEVAIKTVLDLLISRAQRQAYEKQKMAIIGFELAGETGMSKKAVYNFDDQQKELEFELELLQLARRLNGSLIDKGSGTHFIYTTQGDYELLASERPFSQIADEIHLRTSLHFNIGIGSGYTVHGAEQNVQRAFEYEEAEIGRKIIYVDEDGISQFGEFGGEPLPNITLPAFWNKVLKENGYRVHIPLKIYQYIKLKNIPHFTSDMVTPLLKNTERNSRRILSELEQMGLIRVLAEETPSGKRGRPKKAYELVLGEEK